MIGTKLAHYQITTHLGSGGMGDVYQATDSKLGRSVAIKLLPEAFTHDADRAARFEREARVLASLNHPNIAAIYGIEEAGGRKFLVMELVPGETLAERIKRGPIAVNEALGIAKEIADGLEAAHEKGIIHRDLKPANVKIAPDGRVKVLDFGLAKAYEPEVTHTNLSNSPTLSMAATNAGVIMGTAAYMSPEQAKGKMVDRRADIWAFGVVVYEMLAGRMMFSEDTPSETMAAVMMRDPSWNALPVNTPTRLRELLRRCLVKEPRNRLQAIGDARIAIEDSLSGSEIDGHMAPSPSRRRERIAWISAMLFVILTASVAIVLAFRLLPASSVMRLDITTPPTSDPTSFAISPDGKKIVFVASDEGQPHLWLRAIDGTTATVLAGTEGATLPFWKPDGKSLGFFTGNELKRMDLDGGLPRKLADVTAAGSRGAAWSSDGVILFALSTNSPLFQISDSGGQASPVTQIDPPRQTGHRFPQFLPDGQQFLFYATGMPDTRGVYLGSLGSPETKFLTAADTFALYVEPGYLLFIRQGTLLARAFDPRRGSLTGDSVTLAHPVASTVTTFAGGFSASANGLVVYRPGGASWRQLGWFDRSGKPLGTMGAPDDSDLRNLNLSPDGSHVTVNRTVQGNTDIFTLDGARASRFTFDAALDRNGIWSPDGSRMIFESNRNGIRDLYMSIGPGNEKLILKSPEDKVPNAWSPDGRSFIYMRNSPQSYHDLWVLHLDSDHRTWPFVESSRGADRWAEFSPDGLWVAYMSDESGQMEIYLRPFVEPPAAREGESDASRRDMRNDSAGQLQVSTAGGIFPRWRADGKELYWISPSGQLMAASMTGTGSMLQAGAPKSLFQTRIVGGGYDGGQLRNYDVSKDGRFLINTILDENATPIILLQNWTSLVN